MVRFLFDKMKNIVGKVWIVWLRVNSLPNDKFLDCSKLKALADDKVNVTEELKFVSGIVENKEKGENAGYQHFILFLQCFEKPFFSRLLKVRIEW